MYHCQDCPDLLPMTLAAARRHAKTAGPVARPDGRTTTHRLDRVQVER